MNLLILLLLIIAVIFLFSKTGALEARLRRLERLLEKHDAISAQKPVDKSVSSVTEPPPAIQTAVKPPAQPSPVQVSPKPPLRSSWETDMSPAQNPEWLDTALGWIKRYFTEGNLFVRVGVIILFFGIAFLFKFAYDHSMLPVELRLFGASLGAIVLLAVGWRLRFKREMYGLILEGGGVGILYLTIFAAYRLYDLLPGWLTFPLLLVVVIFSAALAVMQNSRALAVLGISGGFLAPVLASTGEGSHIALFSYYALLNVAILGIAWFKAWRLLNVIGFLFTFVIGSAWGVTAYRTEYFASTEPFLILFFIFYVAIAVLFALRQPPNLKGYVDGTLVFGVPLVGFALQAALVYRFEYGLAFSALATGLFYISLATGIWRRGGEGLRMLAESFLALGVVFASLTIPFALDGEWIATAWALEGAAVLWIAIRQQRRLALVFAVLLQFGAGFGFLRDAGYREASWPLLNSIFIGALFVGLAGLFSAWYLQRHYAAKTWQGMLSTVMLVWGLLWWFGNGFNEIDAYVVTRYELMASLLFTAGSAFVLGLLETRLDWRALRYTLYAYAPALIVFLFIAIVDQRHIFARYGYIAWPLALGIYYWLLKRRDGIALPIKGLTLLHAIAAWSIVIIASIELHWLTDRIAQLGDAWRATTFAIATVFVLQLIIHPRSWPLEEHSRRYLGWVSYPLIILLCFWSLLSDFSRVANMHPLPYLPLLNPLDIMHIIVLATLLLWQRKAAAENTSRLSNTQAFSVVAALAFVWINAVLLRSLHHWAGIPYNLDAMADSMLAQASVSIFWTVLGLGVMVLATQKHWRRVWIIAACLLGIVIVKLFAVDLAGRDTLATIISFIVVGVLMLVVGYFSPLPPKASDTPAEKIAT